MFGFDDAALFAAGGKTAGGLLSSLGDAMIGNYFAKKNAYRNASISSAVNRSDAAWKAKLDYKYALKYADLDFEQARRLGDLSYLLQSTYQQNSAKYQVDSLRKAGLNPILAALNGAGADHPVQVGSGGFGSGPGISDLGSSIGSPFAPRVGIAEAMRDIGSLDVQQSSARNMDSQSAVNEQTKNEKQINTAKSAWSLVQDILSGGNGNGILGFGTKQLNRMSTLNKGFEDKIINKAGDVINGVMSTLGDALTGSENENTAKSSDKPKDVIAPVLQNSSKSPVGSSPSSSSLSDRAKRFTRKAWRYFSSNLSKSPLR